MHFLGQKLTSFEGSCIWPRALGGWAGGSKVSGFGQVRRRDRLAAGAKKQCVKASASWKQEISRDGSFLS